MNGDYIVGTIVATPLSHVRHRIRYVPRTKVGFRGGKESVLDSENFYAKDIL